MVCTLAWVGSSKLLGGFFGAINHAVYGAKGVAKNIACVPACVNAPWFAIAPIYPWALALKGANNGASLS
ncbi:hypothetical protein ID0408_04600 [Helicobacter pylori]